jgi:transcriptional regulator with XRE-family HTH domain
LLTFQQKTPVSDYSQKEAFAVKKDKRKTAGQLVKEFRRGKRMSQMELAERIGVSYQQVQKYEKGTNRISVDRLQQIANALDVPIKEFFSSEKWMVSETQAAYGKVSDDEQRLLHLFRSIKDKKTKRTLLELVKTMSK